MKTLKNYIGKALGIATIFGAGFLPMKSSGQDTLSNKQENFYQTYFINHETAQLDKREIISDEKRYDKILCLGKTLNNVKEQQIHYMKMAQEISGLYWDGKWVNEGKEEYFLDKADSLEKVSKVLETLYETEKNNYFNKKE